MLCLLLFPLEGNISKQKCYMCTCVCVLTVGLNVSMQTVRRTMYSVPSFRQIAV